MPNFLTVFSAISDLVKCKKRGGEINFKAEGTRGLGFKVMVIHEIMIIIYIPSYPLIGSGFEINMRFFFSLRFIGIGLGGVKNFCIMDLPPPVAQQSYDAIVKYNHLACSTVSTALFRKPVTEEREALRNKLCGKMNDKIYYWLVIRRNSESVDSIRDATWATNYNSNDKELTLDKCPRGSG
ncbi:hypothetical protein J437_LFUL009058, partial [Ladona fulva]